jgi:hypothetical protein
MSILSCHLPYTSTDRANSATLECCLFFSAPFSMCRLNEEEGEAGAHGDCAHRPIHPIWTLKSRAREGSLSRCAWGTVTQRLELITLSGAGC